MSQRFPNNVIHIEGLPTLDLFRNFILPHSPHPYNRQFPHPNFTHPFENIARLNVSTSVKHNITVPRYSQLSGHILLTTTCKVNSTLIQLTHEESNSTGIVFRSLDDFYPHAISRNYSGFKTQGGSSVVITFFLPASSRKTKKVTAIATLSEYQNCIDKAYLRFSLNIKNHYDWLLLNTILLTYDNLRSAFHAVMSKLPDDRSDTHYQAEQFHQSFLAINSQTMHWIYAYAIALSKKIIHSTPQLVSTISPANTISDSPSQFFKLYAPTNIPPYTLNV